MLWVYKRRIPTKCSDVRDFIIVLKWIHKHFCELKEETRKIGALLIGGALTIRVNFNHFFLSLELALDRFGSTSLRRLMVSNNRTLYSPSPCVIHSINPFYMFIGFNIFADFICVFTSFLIISTSFNFISTQTHIIYLVAIIYLSCNNSVYHVHLEMAHWMKRHRNIPFQSI